MKIKRLIMLLAIVLLISKSTYCAYGVKFEDNYLRVSAAHLSCSVIVLRPYAGISLEGISLTVQHFEDAGTYTKLLSANVPLKNEMTVAFDWAGGPEAHYRIYCDKKQPDGSKSRIRCECILTWGYHKNRHGSPRENIKCDQGVAGLTSIGNFKPLCMRGVTLMERDKDYCGN